MVMHQNYSNYLMVFVFLKNSLILSHPRIHPFKVYHLVA